MTVMALIIVGVIAGWLAGQVMQGYAFGLLADIVIGIIGAVLGGYLFHATGVELGGGMLGSIVVAFAGAMLLLFIVRVVQGGPSKRKTS
jgi:uncharacterized membrane protein YeaQ/YmgE (transglycosylase-associated protein family)